MKKKLLVSLLVLVMCITLVGCGKKESNESGNNNQNNTNNGTSTEKYEYSYVDGVLTPIVDEKGNPKQTDFVIDGIILVGNRHNYGEIESDTPEVIKKFVTQGYNKENINSSFFLNEWIELYIDTSYSGNESDVKIFITPHKTVEELEGLSLAKLEELALDNGGAVIDYQEPDLENYKYVGEGYVNMDYPEGKYDILFTYKGKLAYFININEKIEVEE